ncbi:hypothetical protein [Legionella sp. WA2022007384]
MSEIVVKILEILFNLNQMRPVSQYAPRFTPESNDQAKEYIYNLQQYLLDNPNLSLTEIKSAFPYAVSAKDMPSWLHLSFRQMEAMGEQGINNF